METRITLYTFFIFSACIIKLTLASNPCCNGENVLIDKSCSDGSPVNGLTCPQKYLVDSKNEDYFIDIYDNLVIYEGKISNDSYCTSQISNSSIVLICFPEDDDYNHSNNFKFTLYATFELISVFFILLTIFVYLQVTDILDLEGKCILHSISGLAISFVVLSINNLNSEPFEQTLCECIAYIIYFSIFYAFFWFHLLAFHIWRTVIKPNILLNHSQIVYHVIGIGGPSICLFVLCLAHNIGVKESHLHPGLGETKCWFKSIETEFVYFYGPVSLLLTINLIYYIWTVVVLWKRIRQYKATNNKVLKFKLVLCVKLFIIMGITWIFEVLSAAFQIQSIWFITDCINTLQGVAIFFILVVFRKRVIRGLASRTFCGRRLPDHWRALKDDECEDIEDEINLSYIQKI